jgi:hypothetical protein
VRASAGTEKPRRNGWVEHIARIGGVLPIRGILPRTLDCLARKHDKVGLDSYPLGSACRLSLHWRVTRFRNDDRKPVDRRSALSAPHAEIGRGLDQPLGLSIGCVPIRLYNCDGAILEAARERYAAFEAAHDQPFAISLSDQPSEDTNGSDFSYDFEGAVLHTDAGRSHFTGVRNEYALDSLLRIQLSWMLLERSGFLLHAATVTRNGRAYVFTGRSGAGKSTVASLAPAGTVLTDEISLLRFESGEWRAYGTPFWGEFRAAGSNSSAPVAGIFRLVQAPENAVAPLRPVELMRILLPNILFFSADPLANKTLLEILTRATAAIVGYTLEFRKGPSFWEVLPQ